MHWRREWQPTPVFLPGRIPGTGEPGGLPSMGSQSRTRLRRLSSSSSSSVYMWASLVAQMVKNLLAMQETRVKSLGQEDPLEKGMATHSRILAWRIRWREEPGGLQSIGSQELNSIGL